MSEAPSLDEVQLVIFKLGDSEFGVDIFQVFEISKMMPVTKIPTAPIHIEGVINMRGQICTLIDLRTRLGLEKIPPTDETSIILVEAKEDNLVGMIVDSVLGVLKIKNEQIEYNPSLVSDDIDEKYIKGVAKQDEKLIILLDLTKVLKSHELDRLAELTKSAEKHIKKEMKESGSHSKDELKKKEQELKEKERKLKELEEKEKEMEKKLKKDMKKIEEQRKVQLELEKQLLNSMDKEYSSKKKKK